MRNRFTISLLILACVAEAYITSYDQPWTFQCPARQHMSVIRSNHDNRREDRVFDFRCTANRKLLLHCSWTQYINRFDETFDFECPFNSVLTGISSYHDNRREDRRYKFKCCIPKTPTSDCTLTNWLNDYDKDMYFGAPAGRVITGVKSEHSNRREDRRFAIRSCKL